MREERGICMRRWATFGVVWMGVKKDGQQVAEWVVKMAGRMVVLLCACK